MSATAPGPKTDRPPQYVATPRPTSDLAVFSFTLALLWFAGIGSLCAVILALLALRETRSGAKAGHRLAIAGLVLGFLGAVGAYLLIWRWGGLYGLTAPT